MAVAQFFLPGITPGDILDYSFDWSDWLETGDTIVDADVTGTPAGLTISNTFIAGDVVTFFVSNAVLYTSYTIHCEIVTAEGLTATRSAVLNCTKL